MLNTRIVSLLLAASLWAAPVWAKTYPLPPANSRNHRRAGGLHSANRAIIWSWLASIPRSAFWRCSRPILGVDPYLPTLGTRLTLPTHAAARRAAGRHRHQPAGAAALLLPKDKAEVMVLPIGIGDIGRGRRR